jgi:hypothetical protein
MQTVCITSMQTVCIILHSRAGLADRLGLHDTSCLTVTVLKDLLLKDCCPCCPSCVFTVSLSRVPP